MTSTSFEPGWNWPENLPGRFTTSDESLNHKEVGDANSEKEAAKSSLRDGERPSAQKPPVEDIRPSPPAESPRPTTTSELPEQNQPQPGRRRTHWGPRTCRICLEAVHPTFETPSENLPGVFQGMPSVTYVSEEGGRLIRPCLCKGSQKYVHEGCLRAWRLQDPNNKRNYWQCPTCKYSYRLERLTWAHWISNTATQVGLTVAIFVFATFALGYVADPIINLYLDPYTTVTSPFDEPGLQYEDEPSGWLEHFAKGLASIGLLGFAKFIFTLSPFHWFNIRGSTVMNPGGRAGATGRDRLQQLNFAVVLVGIVTVLWAVWKGVRAWSRRTLTRASESVMDVPLAADDNDEDD